MNHIPDFSLLLSEFLARRSFFSLAALRTTWPFSTFLLFFFLEFSFIAPKLERPEEEQFYYFRQLSGSEDDGLYE